jgi:hypothetical protein
MRKSSRVICKEGVDLQGFTVPMRKETSRTKIEIRTACPTSLHLDHHNELLLCDPSFEYFMTGSLTKPSAKIMGVEISVVIPKSNAIPMLVQPLLIERKSVSDVFVNLPVDLKLPRAISYAALCHVSATPGVCVVDIRSITWQKKRPTTPVAKY